MFPHFIGGPGRPLKGEESFRLLLYLIKAHLRFLGLIRLRLNTLQLAAGMIGLRLRLRPDMKARRTAPKLVRAKAG